MAPDPAIGRRAALALAAASAMSACRARPAPPTALPAARTDGKPATTLPAFMSWQPHPGEIQVEAKLAAVRRIERAGNVSGRRLHVIDAQYGGLLSDSASVLVVCESWALDHGRIVSDGHTFDVRLIRSGTAWQVTLVRPSSPGRPQAGLSTAARRVLATSRISLPPAARGDVEAGQVHDSVLETMLAVSKRWPIAVSVVRSGHPQYVFGTTRLSDHPRGRAFDTWAIDQVPVVAAGAPNPAVPAYMEALAALGSYNVGGPVLLGAAPQFFSDQTHHDHVHAGFLT
ncbi:hypothetical protein Back2_02350 [Nocardioides baekrokdamisoli]|uniref:Uncharacterized protein n=1 Tax=Nocardioides baekrokdamisoli TaxID=1804624 RepID=A0A3G9IXE5_9ACTN|nr:hypothetical protein [Nocardioides baekrokdamisoli]BBH15948.1 hypothetical protein Back2_02350 [Nocardioides baekrokdamisoli]